MKSLLAPLLAMAVLAMGLTAPAQASDPRSRLLAERQQLEQRFDAEEQACAGRFAVYACIEDSRARRRAALAPVREQLLRMDDAERQQRAEARREAVARKQAEVAARLASAPESPAEPVSPPPARPQVPAAVAPPASSPPPRRPADEAAAARRAAALEEATRRAAETQRRIDQRLQRQREERARQGREPDTLPRPGAASAPTR
jgi:colicin import membrane protein